MRCSVCGGDLTSSLNVSSRISRVPKGLDRSQRVKANIWFCKMCNSVTCRQTDFDVISYSDRSTCFAASVATLSTSDRGNPYSTSLLPSLIHPYLVGRSFLDYGCGAGYFTSQLSRYCTSIQGIDLDPQAVDSVQSLGIICHKGDLDKLGSIEYDSISLVGVIEHFEYPLEALSRLISHRSASTSTFLIYYPSLKSLSRLLSQYAPHSWDMFLEPGHNSFPSEESITCYMKAHNYRLVHSWTTSSIVRGKIPLLPFRNAYLEAIVLKLIHSSRLALFVYRALFRILDIVKLGDIACLCYVSTE